MGNNKKVLVLGYGAMGLYLVPELSQMGYKVDVFCLDGIKDSYPNVTFNKADCKADGFLKNLIENGNYDAVVDFLIYSSAEFQKIHPIFLENTMHYIHPSSYRVYSSNELPIKETSPLLLNVSEDKDFLATEEHEYSLYKARKEKILHASKYRNWTILRPAITYSKYRFQLVTLEANVVIERSRKHKTVILPEQAMEIQATMSWAGDVAKMIARLVFNPRAMGETYSVCTAEHNTWRQVAEYYKEITGLEYITVDTDTYVNLLGGSAGVRYQLLYDRCLNRIMDNSKILEVTGLKQSDIMPLKQGLAREYAALPKDYVWSKTAINNTMDEYLAKRS